MASVIDDYPADIYGMQKGLTLTSDGVIHSAFSDYATGVVYHKESFDGGILWVNKEEVGQGTTPPFCGVLVDEFDNLHFFYVQTPGELKHRIKRIDGSWEPVNSLGSCNAVYAACADGDIVHLLDYGLARNIYYRRYTEDAWTERTIVTNDEYPDGMKAGSRMNASVDGVGQVHCARISGWPQYMNRVRYLYGNWSLWEQELEIWAGSTIQADWTRRISIVTDMHDLPHVFWISYTTNYFMYHATRTVDHVWTVEVISDPLGASWYLDSTIDAKGRICVVRQDTGGIWMRRWHPDAPEEVEYFLVESTSTPNNLTALWSRNPRLTQCRQLYLGEFGMCCAWRVAGGPLSFLSALTSDICISGEYDIPSTGGSAIEPNVLVESYTTFYAQPFNAPTQRMTLTYLFETDISEDCDGEEIRNSKTYGVTRSIEMELAQHDEITELFKSIVETGETLARVPIWCFVTKLTQTIMPGADTCYVEDAEEFVVGGRLVVKVGKLASSHEIESKDDITGEIVITDTFTHYMNENEALVAPVIEGFIDISSYEQIGARGSTEVTLKLIERVDASSEGIAASSVTLALKATDDSETDHAIHSNKQIEGIDTGIIDYALYGTDQPIIYERDFVVSTKDQFKELRQAFLSSRGREQQMRLCTFERELNTDEYAAKSATDMLVTPSSYTTMWEKYDQLMVEHGETPQLLTVSNAVVEGDGARVTFSPALDEALVKGVPVHFVPRARFDEDSLSFEFHGEWLASVKTSFKEIAA